MAHVVDEIARPFLTLHVFGSRGSGKKLFKEQWFASSHSRVISEIADVHIRIQKEQSLEGCGLNTSRPDLTNRAFLVLYRPDSQGSRAHARECLATIYQQSRGAALGVVVVENHFEPTFKPLAEEPSELPPVGLGDLPMSLTYPPKFWSVRVNESVQLLNVFNHVIIQPLLGLMDEEAKAKVMVSACRDGKVKVLKLLVGTMEDSSPASWLTHTMASMEDQGRSSAREVALMDVARFAYNLDHTLSMSAIVRLAERYPRASLHLLNAFSQQSIEGEHFVMSGLALVSLPTSWVADHTFTHINISNNLLAAIPDELFQLSALRGLNVSHNCLASLPSVLKWNCPLLRDLNVSHNRLTDVTYCILERGNRHSSMEQRNPGILRSGEPDKEDQKIHFTAAQRVLRLTGYNLYPCIRSLSRVNISHNPSLTQVPEWVCVLHHLTLLEMQGLPKLVRITPYLSHCHFLCVLKVDTEGLASPPVEEAQRGTRAIMAYLRCKLRGSTPYKHVKLVLVGGSGSGKTALFSQLMGTKASSSGAPTPHIDIASFEFPLKGKASKGKPRITFHVFDFAGNEVYQCTHQCFLTYRSIYLCLWDLTEGKEGLRRLVPWLKNIQACVPGSPVILVATHADRRPTISGSTVLQWEEEVFGDASQLRKMSYASRLGLPPILHSVIMDCLNREDVELLMNDVYEIALQMRHPRTKVLLIEDTVPHSYQALQSLVDVKIRTLRRELHAAPVLRYEEFVDYVRSLTLHHDDLEEDEEEFALACNFLHDVGTIIQFKPHLVGMSDLYFLDPQWLFNALASIISSHTRSPVPNKAVIDCLALPTLFEAAEVPPSLYNSFLSMMEAFNILVSLDMEKKSFLFPSLLPDSPPPHYPHYDLGSEDAGITQYFQFRYLPNGFFSRLLARVVIYIRQLSGQLLAASSDPLLPGEDEDDIDGGFPSKALSVATKWLSRSHSFRLDQLGYVCRDDAAIGGSLRNKIWALSNAAGMATPTTRHRALTEKLVSLSQPILEQRKHSPSFVVEDDSSSSLSHFDNFASYCFWKSGLFVEFPLDGTKFWLEACDSAVVLIISGAAIPRVKVLSFITSCVDVLVEECYAGLDVSYYSPCPSCMRRFWEESLSARGRTPSFASSLDLSLSHVISLNEFKEKAVFSRRGSVDSIRSYSFSGSSLKISRSPTPPDVQASCDLPVAILDDRMALFPLATTIQQSIRGSSLTCPKCKVPVALRSLSPHVLLVDFADSFLLNPRLLQFSDEEASLLGKGGFGKVLHGSYNGQPVAVKVFRRPYKQQESVQRYKDLREELAIMSHLKHPRVVSLVGVTLRPLCIIMELAPRGSLSDHLELCPHGLRHSVAHQLLFQIADGMRYLHSLYIIHRDIKPGNVLVWRLHPETGVDVRLADYGVSQFSTPSGLRRHKGTEEYMAPELFRSHGNQTYDEKVDIFSFALLLHWVVSGKKLFSNMVNRREQLRMVYHSDMPQLSHALSEALEENKPYPPPEQDTLGLLEEGRHPAARRDLIASCHSTCMQRLMENCLSLTPSSRPTAQGICSQLLLCPGEHLQINFFITTLVSSATYCPDANMIVAMQENSAHLLLVPQGSWQVQQAQIPYEGEKIGCFTCVGKELFFASLESNLMFSLHVPSLTSGHISHEPLPGTPLCIFPHFHSSGIRIVVGMSGGRIAVFSPPSGGGHQLESKPIVSQVINHPDAHKTAISCGLYHRKTLWCGCGRHLIGLDTKDYLLKHYKPVIREQTSIVAMAAASGHLWLGFEDRSEVVVCDVYNANSLDTIDCRTILGSSTPVQAIVSNIASSPEAVWVGTRGGHLIAFDQLTSEVLLVHRRHASISAIVWVKQGQLVSFGQSLISEDEGEESDDSGMFTVWTSYLSCRSYS